MKRSLFVALGLSASLIGCSWTGRRRRESDAPAPRPSGEVIATIER